MAEQRVTLNLDSTAQTGGFLAFIAGLGRVKGAIVGITSALPALHSGLARLTAVLGPLALAGAVVKFTKAAIDAADAMAEQAQVAGTSVENFTALSAVAGMAGLKTMDLAMAAKSLGEWMAKTNRTGEDFTAVLLEQADLFSKMEDGLTKTSRAAEIFGHKHGSMFIPLLNQGSEAIRAQMEDASNYAKALARTAPEADKFNDNLARLGLIVKTVFMEFAAKVLPVLNEFLESMMKFVKDNGLHVGVINTLIDGFKVLASTIALSVAQIELLKLGLQSGLSTGAITGFFVKAPQSGGLEAIRKSLSDRLAAINSIKPFEPGAASAKGASPPPDPTESFNTQMKVLELKQKGLELDAQELGMRGLIQDVMVNGNIVGTMTVGTLTQEAEGLRSIYAAQLKVVEAKEKALKIALESKVISEVEADEKRLAIDQERLRIEKEILGLKEKTNDFTFFEKLGRNFEDMADRMASFGANLADIFSGGLLSAIDAVSNGIWGIIDGTLTWGELAQQVGRQIISQLISLAIQETIVLGVKKAAAATWKAFTSSMRAADVIEANATEAAKAPALAANATLASISSWGIAVVIGLAAIAGILAATGAFEQGGVVRGGRQFIQVNESGEESVLNARATAALGHSTINAFNSGMFDLESRAAGSFGTVSSGNMNLSSGVGVGSQASEIKLTLVLVDSRNSQAAMEALVSSAGRAAIVEIVRDERTEIGIKT